MKRRAIGPLLVGLCLLAILLATPASAQPPLPHAFYGTVEFNGQPAAVGTEVEARGERVRTGIEGNPITLTEAGKYGGPGGLDPKLIVQGDLENGTPIEFYIDGVRAECYDPETGEWVDTYPFESGAVTKLNLAATGPTPTPTATLGPGTPSPTPTPTATSRIPTLAPSPTPPAMPTPPTPGGPTAIPTSTPVPPSPTPTATPTSTPKPSTPGPTAPPLTPKIPAPIPTLSLSETEGGGSPPLLIAIGLAGIVAIALAVLWGKKLWGGGR